LAAYRIYRNAGRDRHEPRRTLAAQACFDDALGHHKPPDGSPGHTITTLGATRSVLLCSQASQPFLLPSSAPWRPTSTTTTPQALGYGLPDLRIRIYENLHRFSLGYYDNVKTGALMGRDAQPYPFGILPRNNQ
jgi:hypothetical protein